MHDLIDALQKDPGHAWLLFPSAILLGALHALEPGHSKTMMAAFVVAIRGTVWQAALLGISAALSHSLLIWVLAIFGLRYNLLMAGKAEPFLLLLSALIIFGLAAWMFLRTRRELHEAHEHHHQDHGNDGHAHHHRGHHDHENSAEYQDAHEMQHAEEIRRRFAGRAVTTPQIILFGVTGGMIPCPSAFVVLLVCLQLKRAILGFTMVAAFSLGLAITMVTVGTLAALSAQHAQKHFRGFAEAMRRAPYISCLLLLALGCYMAWQGWNGLR